MARYLSTQEVLHVHDRLIERTGGTPGLRDVNLLESVLNRPKALAGGEDMYSTPARKGAILMYSLVLNQLFVDGNKRTGLVCLDLFLRLNQVRLSADAVERHQFLTDVCEESLSIEQMAEWIDAHSGPEKAAAPEPRRRTAAKPSRRLTITAPEGASLDLNPDR